MNQPHQLVHALVPREVTFSVPYAAATCLYSDGGACTGAEWSQSLSLATCNGIHRAGHLWPILLLLSPQLAYCSLSLTVAMAAHSSSHGMHLGCCSHQALPLWRSSMAFGFPLCSRRRWQPSPQRRHACSFSPATHLHPQASSLPSLFRTAGYGALHACCGSSTPQ